MKILFLKTTTLMLMAGLLLCSCKKDKEKDADLDANTTTDNANSQSVADDMAKVTEDAVTANGNGTAKLAAGIAISCATVDTNRINSTTKIFTISFDGTTCQDGKVRSGTITATLTGGSYNTPGAVLTIVTTNYKVNNVTLTGKKVITCISNDNQQPVHTIAVSDLSGSGYAKITYGNGDTAVWKSNRTRKLVEGGNDVLLGNNKYDVSATTGIGNPSASGINRNGRSYTVDITSPLRIDLSCIASNKARYPTQGIIVIHPSGKNDRTVDYGNGACDNQAVVSIGGNQYTIGLSY